MTTTFLSNARVINLTPHELTIYDGDGKSILAKIPPSGVVARVSMRQEKIGEVNGMPIYRSVWGEVENLPLPEENTVYVVSQIVLQALGGRRRDVVAPNTALAVRDDRGQIIGVRGFIGGY